MKIVWIVFEPFRYLLRTIDGWCIRLAQPPLNPQLAVQGACKKRGVCCRNVVVVPAAEFWEIPGLISAVILWYRAIYNFRLHKQVATERCLVFECGYLAGDHCGIYARRPYICRAYPSLRGFRPPSLLPGCGYRVQTKEN